MADVGFGTGLLAERFLDVGCRVVGVEPNDAMRRAGHDRLSDRAALRIVDGRAEYTGLADSSVDLVAAGQAFHWFRVDDARAEFKRILVPGGWVLLVWNRRNVEDSALMAAYDDLLQRHCPEYSQIKGRGQDAEDVEALFSHFETATFPNVQVLDRQGLRGRLLSSSYAPAPGEPGHPAMMEALEELWLAHAAEAGPDTGPSVTFEYETRAYVGQLD